MINLLPDEHKKELRAARTNVILLRYNILTIVAVGFLILSLGAFFAYLSATEAQRKEENQANQAKALTYSDTKKQAEEYRANLATAKQILANQVDYTSVVFGVTKLLPKGVVLDDVNLSAKDFGNQTVFSARASSYETATQLKKSFQESSLFTNVFFQSITNSTDSADKAHPISVSISVKINKVTK